MTLEDQLKSIIKSRYKSIRDFSVSNNIPYSTIDSVLKRGIKGSSIDVALKIFRALDLDIESVATGTLQPLIQNKTSIPDSPEIDARLQHITNCYYGMDDVGKDVLVEQAEFLLSRHPKCKSASDTA